MTRNAQDIIDDMRNIVKPRIAKMLLEANFEGYGKEDKAEFETEFEMVLTLAEMGLKNPQIPDKATNGDMIKAMFNDFESALLLQVISKEWWNAPYKGGEG